MKIFAAFIIFFCASLQVHAKSLDFLKVYFENNKENYVVFVDKEEKRLYLVNRDLKTLRIYNIATGKTAGNKLYKGDKRTPRGAYRITQIWEYKKPLKLFDMELVLEKSEKGTASYKKLRKKYEKEIKKYDKGRLSLERMNAVYFKASDGFSKWGRDEDLGRRAYGTVFMRLSFPNAADRKRHEEAKKKGLIPRDSGGRHIPPGSGIAIHGTNDPASLGNNASSGCIRMLNSNIEELREYVNVGSIVVIK
ncbi:MAG: L,D-transpeptidase family protein [Candidatus Goldiibacteriota bacterium]